MTIFNKYFPIGVVEVKSQTAVKIVIKVMQILEACGYK